MYKVKVEDERRAEILGALDGAEAIKDQWMHKSTFQLPTISGTFLHLCQEKAKLIAFVDFFYSAICIVRILGLLAQLKFKMQEHLHAMAIYVMRLKIDTAML